ncbi:MAG: O-antigen ligase family protein [Altererythrobacter sp.]|nr:O-antigen ligase family protein [Altererythrobacter sp.]
MRKNQHLTGRLVGILRNTKAERARFSAFAAFIAIVFLLGGGSRSDILSLVLLRPVALVFALYALLVADKEQFAIVRTPLLLLGALALLILIQIIPLPPSIWTQLPERKVIAGIYDVAGMPRPWSPIALSPSRAWNAFFSLSIPCAALLMFAIQGRGFRRQVLLVIWLAAISSALLGILQLAGSPRGPFYLYRITNNGLPVGLFANRNHQALLISIGILLSGYLIYRAQSWRTARVLLSALAAGMLLLFLLFLLIAGSRAGLVIGSGMLLPASYLAYYGFTNSQNGPKKFEIRNKYTRMFLTLGFVAAFLIFLASIYFSRSLAFDRLMNTGGDFELRSEIFPDIIRLVRDYFPIGSGFGSFEFVYKRIEGLDLLRPSYLNQAHNDWLQIVVEGGLGGVLILLAFLAWFVRRACAIFPRRGRALNLEALACVFVIVAFGAASVVDYPLRVPSLMAVFAIACGFLAPRRDQRIV